MISDNRASALGYVTSLGLNRLSVTMRKSILMSHFEESEAIAKAEIKESE